MQKHNFRRLAERLTYPLALPDPVPKGLTALSLTAPLDPTRHSYAAAPKVALREQVKVTRWLLTDDGTGLYLVGYEPGSALFLTPSFEQINY